jgi:bifunctional non-homologous end joining protein LigD
MVKTDGTIKFGKVGVSLTHIEKIFWPEEGITKGMVIDYYQSISEFILPFLKNRPESLLRNPNGILDKGFFHKDAGKESPAWIKTFNVPSESSHKIIHYVLCNNKAALAYLNNLGCIELNPWHSTSLNPDYPDYMIIDLDPAIKNHFEQVIEVANSVRDELSFIGAESFCKTSGGKGIHIYVPMGKRYHYDLVKSFARRICVRVHGKLPGLTTLDRPLKKRGKKIYLDFLQNCKGQTIASVYSLRPRPGAPVSMPLEWRELKPGLSPSDFNIFNAPARIRRKKDLFAPVLGKPVNLRQFLENLSD